jgi:hypothetical protein
MGFKAHLPQVPQALALPKYVVLRALVQQQHPIKDHEHRIGLGFLRFSWQDLSVWV